MKGGMLYVERGEKGGGEGKEGGKVLMHYEFRWCEKGETMVRC